MPLTDAARVIADCNLPDEISDKLAPHIAKAEIRLREYIGDAKYDELVTGGNSDEKEKATHAESLITLFIAVPFLNMQ